MGGAEGQRGGAFRAVLAEVVCWGAKMEERQSSSLKEPGHSLLTEH